MWQGKLEPENFFKSTVQQISTQMLNLYAKIGITTHLMVRRRLKEIRTIFTSGPPLISTTMKNLRVENFG